MRKHLLNTLVLLCAVLGFGQSTELPNLAPKSPEASAFLKYGDYPVDLSAGLTGVTIPIYTIKSGGFELPVSLNYHPSGIKVSEEASWVGLGWNLSAGAQIILDVNDAPDEYNINTYDNLPVAADIYTYMSANPDNYHSSYYSTFKSESWVRDVYNFSSPTASGKFVVDKFSPFEVTVYPPEAFKVERYTGAGDLSKRFKITDPYGNVYIFNNTGESSVTLGQYQPPTYTSAWFVDRIETANNDVIEFLYINGGVINQVNYGEVINHTKTLIPNFQCIEGTLPHTETISSLLNTNSTLHTQTKKLSQIIFKSGRLIFNSSGGRLDFNDQNNTGPKKLDNIEIQSKNPQTGVYSTISRHQFYYSYFIGSGTGSTDETHRLRLDKVSNLLGIDQPEETIFTYSNIQLPGKSSRSVDYWGYFNGKSNYYSRIPHQVIHYSPSGISTSYESVGNADRSVNPLTIEAGSLKSIKYPTKGETRFEYEPNNYFGTDRFDKFNLNTVNGTTVQGTGNGQYAITNPQSEVQCLQDPQQCIQVATIPFTAINANGTLTYQHTNPVGSDPTLIKHQFTNVTIFYNNGQTVYSNKTSSGTHQITANINNLNGSGYIVIEAYGQYMRISDLQLKFYNNDLTPKNVYGMGMRIKSITNYDNDATTIRAKKEYEYVKKDNMAQSSGILLNDILPLFQSYSSTCFSPACCNVQNQGSEYPIFGCQWKSVAVQSFYSNSVNGMERNSIVYSEVLEKNVSPIDGSLNGFTVSKFTTDTDYIVDSKGTIRVDFGHKRGKLLTRDTYKGTSIANSKIVNKQTNTYAENDSRVSIVKGFKLFQNGYLSGSIYNVALPQPLNILYEPVSYNVPVKWFYQDSSQSIDYFYDQNDNPAGQVTISTTFNYNNPLHLQLSSEVTTSSAGQVIETKYFYPQDTAMSSEPVRNELIAKNMIAIPLSTQTFKASEKLSELKTIYKNWGNNLLKAEIIQSSKGPLALENRVRYTIIDNTNGNPLELQQEGGTMISYIWGYNKTQPIAKIENASNAQVATALGLNLSTVTEANLSAIDSLRTLLPNALITTYTYLPLIGVSIIKDPKGDVLNYEYDSFGRLGLVKDKDGNKLSQNEYHYKN